ncbi:NAD(P)-dependent oxidoreductase [Goodfellowiella coeruleoviolacea]|uniref:3-hydroxyisobutyrate dehydrogenase n=1 Tax=Goodfellowiella coeruleoviolacea TaxID=334858 RepID=A0AAE3GJU1_9PSEU|nr:NAD(P)-dependent oxidoreductase [Goodfellowiella coeruleoviolacea]MCP2169577.1 3-hydroxyisobutyrate dehydrogenase [Goodfellowiella coeruleoviolacea]
MTTGAPANTRIAVLGTGIIGAALTRNLLGNGFAVHAWNRTRAKAEALAEAGARVAASPAEAVRDAEVVITALTDGPSVLAAMRAAAPGLRAGTVWVQTSTVGDDISDLVALAREHRLSFVDAPVQGTRQPAEQGQLVVLASAAPEVRDTVRPVFDAIGKRTLWVSEDGESGASSRLKLVLNTWVIAMTHGVGETLALARGLDVDPGHVLDVITGGPMDNAYFQGKSAAILSGDYTPSFTVDNAEKDARLVLAAAARANVRMDLVQAGQQRFRRAAEQGHGDEDMAAGYFASFAS